MKLDLIDLYINTSFQDSSGVSAIAVVDDPAIQKPFTAFANQAPKKYKIALGSGKGNYKPMEGSQQTLAGPLMIPDMEIYRKEPLEDGTFKEFNVRFTAQSIKDIQQKFALSNRNTSINEMHNSAMPINGGLIQHFIIDRKAGINPPFGEDIPDGSWYGYIKILDVNTWNNFVKTGIYTGFSVEGEFYEQPITNQTNNEELASVEDFMEWLSKQGHETI